MPTSSIAHETVKERCQNDEIQTRILNDDNPMVPRDHIAIIEASIAKGSDRALLGLTNQKFLEYVK